MAKVQKFEDLTIFQMARDLCKEVYAITKEGEFHNDSRFVQQIHASAGSVMDNNDCVSLSKALSKFIHRYSTFLPPLILSKL